MFFNEKELNRLFKKWDIESIEYAEKKARFDKYMKRLAEASIPFLKREERMLEEKRKKDKNAYLTFEELEEIWRPFRKIRRKIEDEIFDEITLILKPKKYQGG